METWHFFFLGLTDFRGTSLSQNRDSSSTRKFTNTDSENSSLTNLMTFHWHFWRQFMHADERITLFEYEVTCFHCQLPANPPRGYTGNWSILRWIRGRKENHCGGRMSGGQREIAGEEIRSGSKNNYQPGVRLLVKKPLYCTCLVPLVFIMVYCMGCKLF